MGRRMKRTENHVFAPPERVVVTGGVPGITNTTVWTFEPVREGALLPRCGFETVLNGHLKDSPRARNRRLQHSSSRRRGER